MHTFLRKSGFAAAVLSAVSLMIVSCSDPAEDSPPTNNNGGQVTQEEANVFMDRMKFPSSTKITGTLPSVANTSLLKTNSKDTIYTLEELKLPIRITHPASVVVGGVFITVENATSYYDVPIYEEEDSDTVSVIILEVTPADGAPGNVALPGGVPVEIIAYDQSKTPIDVITRIIKVEKPSEGCSLVVDGDSSDFYTDYFYDWIWHSTYVVAADGKPSFINAPYRLYIAEQKPLGCCLEQTSCPVLYFNQATREYEWIYNSEVTANTSYEITNEAFTFYKNGTFIRFTAENIKNFDPELTDWCKKIPAYNDRESLVDYLGTHDYKPGNTSISYITHNKICEDPLGLCGYGSRGGSIEQTCHVLKIIEKTSAADGPTKQQIRVYIRSGSLDMFLRRYVFYA